MDPNVFTYHAALRELERSALDFATRITLAGRASALVQSTEDDAIALSVLENVRKAMLSAFATHPGMIQVFTSSEK